MSQPLPCDNHSDQLATILMTNLETGDTLTLCRLCTVSWAEMLAGLVQEPKTLDEIAQAAIQEQADLEPEPPASDAEPKSEPQPATPPAPEAERGAEVTQESPTPRD